MAHYGLGPSGYFLTTDGFRQLWASGGVEIPTPLDINGLIYANSTTTVTSLPSGNEGDVLSILSGSLAWTPSGQGGGGLSNVPDPLTVDYIVVNSGATLPSFTSLIVDPTGTSQLATITQGTWQADIISEAYGGTGRSSYVAGDILFASGPTTLDVLASGAEGQSLTVNNGALDWIEKLNATGYTNGDILYADNTGSIQSLASGNEGQTLSVSAGTIGWTDVASSSGASPVAVSVETASEVFLLNSEYFVAISGVGQVGVALPSSPDIGQVHVIKDRAGQAATSNIVVSGVAGLIDGSSTTLINNDYQSITVVWDGAQWNII